MTSGKGAGQAPPYSGGIVPDGLRMFGSFVRHFQALGALAGAEGRDALGLYVRLGVMLLAALLFSGVAYFSILFFIAFAIAALFGVAWIWITLGLAVFHLLIAVLCATHVRAHFRTPVFSMTGAEIKKDLAALRGSGSARDAS